MGRARRFGVIAAVLVMLIGGFAVSPSLVGASGTWGTTGGMLTARSYHTATLLPNGKVLVAGGYGNIGYYGNGSLNSTELLDPATGTWTPAAPMNTARDRHTATLLADGRVLVTGGENISYPGGNQQTQFLSSAEIYNPSTNNWSNAGTLQEASVNSSTALLTTGPNAGKVLVVGGLCNSSACNYTSSTVELFDPGTGTASYAASTTRPYRQLFALALNDGQVFVINAYSVASVAEVYNPASNTWTSTPPLAQSTYSAAPVLLASGQVLLASGDLYNPVTNSWSHSGSGTNTSTCGGDVGVRVPSGSAVFIHGCRYDPATDRWSTIPNGSSYMNSGVYTATLLADGRVLLAGGGYPSINSVQLYNDTPFTIALSATAGGSAAVTPAGPYTGGASVTLTATASPGYLFTGWTVDGKLASYANPLPLTINDASRTVVANFGPLSSFSDVAPGTPAADAIAQLAARGIIKGYQDGRFGPADHTLRAQMAALICRAVGWDTESHPNPFTDRNGVDDGLWQNIGTLNFHDVAHGYSYNTYGTTDDVLNVQVIAFVSRAMVSKGYWVQQSADSTLYPNVPASSGHQGDLATYVHYAGALPDNPNTGGAFANWDQSSTRAYFARTLWQALSSYFATNRVP
jgi:N-acetylneuraminic acid mutarotase